MNNDNIPCCVFQNTLNSITLNQISSLLKSKLIWFPYIYEMLSSFLDIMSALSKTTWPQKRFRSNCITIYKIMQNHHRVFQVRSHCRLGMGFIGWRKKI